jgi:hypothetical protein
MRIPWWEYDVEGDLDSKIAFISNNRTHGGFVLCGGRGVVQEVNVI